MHVLTTVLPKQITAWHAGRSAIRMLVAALGAFVCTTLIHLPGPYSAVITTLIVARPHSGGVHVAGVRLLGVSLGAVIGALVCAWRARREIRPPECGRCRVAAHRSVMAAFVNDFTSHDCQVDARFQ
jgi:hypothetical protein